MPAADNLALLPSLSPELLQEELPPLQEPWLFREYIWRSSWLERLAMLIVPCLLLLVFVQTTGQYNTAYRACHDTQFYGSDPRHSWEIFQLSGEKIFGWTVSEPKPLISHQELIKQTRRANPHAQGLSLMQPGEWLYPRSLIPQVGLSRSEIYVYIILIGGLLIIWIIFAVWNIGSFAIQRQRIRSYARYNLVSPSDAKDANSVLA